MSNNYTLFSEKIYALDPEEQGWVKTELKSREYESYICKWELEYHDKKTNLWLYSEDGCDLEELEKFVRAFLCKFRPTGSFMMTWAEICDKSRVAEFGGGWMVVTANETRYGNTWDAMIAMEKEMSCMQSLD